MESDSENDRHSLSETRSRNSSLSSSEEVRPPDREEPPPEPVQSTETLRRRIGVTPDKAPPQSKRSPRDYENSGTIHYRGVTLPVAAAQGSIVY